MGMTRSQIEDDKEESKTSDGIQNFEHIQSGFNRQAGCTQYLRRQAIANDTVFNSETPPLKSKNSFSNLPPNFKTDEQESKQIDIPKDKPSFEMMDSIDDINTSKLD